MSFFGLVPATEAVLSPIADVSLDTLATFDDQPSVLFSPHPQLGSLMDFEYYDRQELHTISIAAKKQKSLNDAGSYAGQASSSDTASPVTASRSPVIGTAPSSPVIHSPASARQRLSMSPRVRALSRAASLEDVLIIRGLEPYYGVADASPHRGASAIEQLCHPFASHSIAFFTDFAHCACRHAPYPCAYPGEAQVRAPSASLPGFYPVAHVAGARRELL
ncbi:hypothetical protein FB107DRAFT_258154, partial [Schizophyllum commune]